jgi:hypothetical protein
MIFLKLERNNKIILYALYHTTKNIGNPCPFNEYYFDIIEVLLPSLDDQIKVKKRGVRVKYVSRFSNSDVHIIEIL